ncbi:MAG TPA: hypothetical protein VHO25_17035, partial [Polyangiaceae bacterium]|nr:hypothetical protein [Polyangiaceae bacterium]
ERARKALEAVLPDDDGVIFGKHDYREHIFEAAKAVLGEARAEEFCASHLRSARITHLLERTKNMAGVQHLAGHLRTSTTARYVRPTLRAALDVIRETESPAPRKRRAG